MSLSEATRLFFELIRDPSSHVSAALSAWKNPVSREWIALTDLIDVHRALNHDKRRGTFKPSPRPWPDPEGTRIGRATRPQSEIRAALASRAPGSTTVRPRDERGRFTAMK